MPKGGVKDFVLSLLPELGTMGSNEGEVWVTGLSTLLIYDHVSINWVQYNRHYWKLISGFLYFNGLEN